MEGKGGDNRSRWKVRAAKVEVTSPKGKKLHKRPLQNLTPIKVRCGIDLEQSATDKAEIENSCGETDMNASPSLRNRPRHNAATIADLVRRYIL